MLLYGILCEYSKVDVNENVRIPFNVVPGSSRNLFLSPCISSYHFDSLYMLVFVSNNSIENHRFGIGRTQGSYLLSYPR